MLGTLQPYGRDARSRHFVRVATVSRSNDDAYSYDKDSDYVDDNESERKTQYPDRGDPYEGGLATAASRRSSVRRRPRRSELEGPRLSLV